LFFNPIANQISPGVTIKTELTIRLKCKYSILQFCIKLFYIIYLALSDHFKFQQVYCVCVLWVLSSSFILFTWFMSFDPQMQYTHTHTHTHTR